MEHLDPDATTLNLARAIFLLKKKIFSVFDDITNISVNSEHTA
jgi:hypothetical protein